MTTKFRRFLSASLALSAAALVSVSSAADAPSATDLTHAGRSSVYGNLSNGSLEAVSTEASILSLVKAPDSAAPTAIWTMLEHGERVECMACIPYVSKMLYASNPKTREISAWWLRRRIFGVFGKGEVYEQTVNAVSDQSKSPLSRAYAANALGEFGFLALSLQLATLDLLADIDQDDRDEQRGEDQGGDKGWRQRLSSGDGIWPRV